MRARELIDEDLLVRYRELSEVRKKQSKKGAKGFLIFFLICIAIGAILGFSFAILDDIYEFTFTKDKDKFSLYFCLGLIWYFIAYFLNIIIHEAGHLVFGLLSGYRFLSYRILSLTLMKKDGKLVWKHQKTPGIAGQCLMLPPKWEEGKKYPVALYNLGGGLLNLIFCILPIPLFFCGNTMLSWGVGIFLFCGFVVGVTNLIPMTVGIPNDGKNYSYCKKSPQNVYAFYLQLELNARLSCGAHYSDFTEETFRLPDGAKLDNTLTLYVVLKRYDWLLSQSRFEEASEQLDAISEQLMKMPSGVINSVYLERLFLLLRQREEKREEMTEDGILSEKERRFLAEAASYYSVVGPILRVNKSVIDCIRIKITYLCCTSEWERELIDLLSDSKKGKLPAKPIKRKVPSVEECYINAEKIVKRHPVIGEAEYQMKLICQVMKKNEDRKRGENE